MKDASLEAERLLAETGLVGSVRPGGHDGSVAVVRVEPECWPELLGAPGLELARRIRDLGFRHVAIDIAVNRSEDR